MKAALHFLMAVIISWLGSVSITAQQQYRIVGYYPAWNRSILPAAKIQTNNLTHVNHSFAWPTVTGTIQADPDVPDAALITAVHNGGKKVLIALGGWGHEAGFIPVATNPVIRSTFIESLMNFVIQNGYDGVDLDWEFPTNTAQRDSLTSLVREIRAALDEVDSSYLVTMAVPISNWSGQWIDFQKLLPSIDWFNAMAYDIHGSWTNHAGHNAPLYAPPTDFDGSAHQGIQYLNISRGVPKNKITLGVPFYGKQFTASAMYGAQTGVSDLTYTTVLTRIQSGWTYTWDDVSKVPYLSNVSKTAVITFDDTVSLINKCKYIKDNGISGIMVWALGQDVAGTKQPLLEAIGNSLNTTTDIHRESYSIIRDFVLFDNYPNPFNLSTTIKFRIAEEGIATLKIFDVLGREMEILFDEKFFPGEYSSQWNAANVPSGLYVYRLTSGNNQQTKRMVLIK